MKKSNLCTIFCIIFLSIFKVFAVEYFMVNVNVLGPKYRTIVINTRNRKNTKYFWSCAFMGDLPIEIVSFLDKIDKLTVKSKLPICKSLKRACIRYDKQRDGNGYDFKNSAIYLFDYSPDNKYFQCIIKSLQKLVGFQFDLNLLRSIVIR